MRWWRVEHEHDYYERTIRFDFRIWRFHDGLPYIFLSYFHGSSFYLHSSFFVYIHLIAFYIAFTNDSPQSGDLPFIFVFISHSWLYYCICIHFNRAQQCHSFWLGCLFWFRMQLMLIPLMEYYSSVWFFFFLSLVYICMIPSTMLN